MMFILVFAIIENNILQQKGDNAMDKILDRLGIYDLWGVLIPGIIGCVSIKIWLSYLGISLGTGLGNLNNWLIMLVCSYLLGTILQELGHGVLKRFLYKEKDPSYIYLLPTNNILKQYEKGVCEKLLRDVMGISGAIEDEHSRYFYKYCLELLNVWQKSTKAEIFKSLYGMCRSLFCFCMLMGVTTIVFYFGLRINAADIEVLRFVFSFVVSCFLGIIFRMRALRFNEIHVKIVLRTYISVQVKKMKNVRVSNFSQNCRMDTREE